MSKQGAVFVGVMVYSFAAVGLLWMFDMKHSFPGILTACVIGLPLPFAIDWIWERM